MIQLSDNRGATRDEILTTINVLNCCVIILSKVAQIVRKIVQGNATAIIGFAWQIIPNHNFMVMWEVKEPLSPSRPMLHSIDTKCIGMHEFFRLSVAAT